MGGCMIKPHATIPPSKSCINSIFPHICLQITICCQFFSSFPTSPFQISDLHLKSRKSEFHHTQKKITQIRSVGEELLPIDFHFSDYFSFTSKKHQQRHMTIDRCSFNQSYIFIFWKLMYPISRHRKCSNYADAFKTIKNTMNFRYEQTYIWIKQILTC